MTAINTGAVIEKSKGPVAGERRRLSILGSTGSIGSNTVDVIEAKGGCERYEIVALTGNRNIDRIVEQALRLRPRFVALADASLETELKKRLSGSGVEAAAGADAVKEAASLPADWVMSAIVGVAGLAPTLKAIDMGADIALANKECLVAAGELFTQKIQELGSKLLPVDSEHSAISQILQNDSKEIERIIITGSGGPFRDWPLSRLKTVTPREASNHPTWNMGQRITIDSASMFNKALEIIEAHYLFSFAPEQIEVVIHPQSIIHSMVGYRDGSVLAQMSAPDMRAPIAYALGWPERILASVERLDFAKLARLEFFAPDEKRFPALRLAREALASGSLACCVFNSAKEVALDAFIAEKVGFLDMAELVEETLILLAPSGSAGDLSEIFATDRLARQKARELLVSWKRRND